MGNLAMPVFVRASNRSQPDEESISALEIETAQRLNFAKSVAVDVRRDLWKPLLVEAKPSRLGRI